MTRHPSLGERFIAPLHRAGDIDLVIRLAGDARAFAELRPAGEFYCPPVEVIEAERDHGR